MLRFLFNRGMDDSAGQGDVPRPPETAESSTPTDQFLLAEYGRLWDQVVRSQQSTENASRFFVLLVGAAAALGTLVSRTGGEFEFVSQEAAFQILGLAALLVAGVGLLNTLYIANEYFYRVELLRHIGDIRSYFMSLDRLIAPFITMGRGQPTFRPNPAGVSGGFLNYLIAGVLTAAVAFVGYYAFLNATALSELASNKEALPLPQMRQYVLAVSILSFEILMFYFVGHTRSDRYEKNLRDAKGSEGNR